MYKLPRQTYKLSTTILMIMVFAVAIAVSIKAAEVQFRFGTFNVLNHPVVGVPNAYLDSYPLDANGRPDKTVKVTNDLFGAFGAIMNTAAANRQPQFALKLIF